MPVHGFAEFLQGLHACQALDRDQLRALTEQVRSGTADQISLGRELLRRGWMTAYQINQVHRGLADRLVLGPYLLLERLGKGGMGEVLKARHRRMGRLVALKLIRADRRDDPRRLMRFQREVEAAARLDHPNIVHAYDAGMIGELLFLAMEYLEGTDLKRLVRGQGLLPAASACEYLRQAACGLQHAFEQGVVHRDLKPSNLFLSARGQVVKILDLGLARLEDGPAGLTRPGMALGTIDYIAPELFEDPHNADVRSDLYSLGCTLYYLLTGRPPFAEGGQMRKMMARLREDARPVEALRPDVGDELAGLMRRLLARRPEERFQTPEELSEALADLLRRGALPQGGTVPPPGGPGGWDSSTTCFG